MLKLLFLILSLFCYETIISQDNIQPEKILKSKLAIQKNVPDSLLIDDYNTIIKYYTLEGLNADSIIFYGEKILNIYKTPTQQNEALIRRTYQFLSAALWMRSEFGNAIALIEEKFERFPSMTEEGKSLDYLNIGLFNIELGNYIEGIEYLFKAEKGLNELKIKTANEELSWSVDESLSNVYINLALAFENLGDYQRAIAYNQKSVEYLYMSGKQNPDDLALIFGNLCVQYLALGKTQQAKTYIELANKELDSIKQEKTKGFVKYNYGSLAYQMDNWSKAEKLFKEAISHYKTLGVTNDLGQCYRDLGSLYVSQKRFNDALNYLSMAEEIFLTTKSKRDLVKVYYTFSEYYESTGNSDLAYSYLKKHISANNKIVSDQIQQEVVRKDLTNQYEKQQYADSMQNAKKEAINAEKLKRKETELSAQRSRQIILGSGLLISAALLFLVYIRFKQNLKQKKIIEQQHITLSKKNKEVLDSINYAKRLQNAILPRTSVFQKYLKRSFVFYLPKDIVAGDFYFYDVVKKEDKKYVFFAAADCTGHGVPGAMVSIVGANGLKRCIQEFGLLKPSDILDRVALLVAAHFSQSEEKIRDGMDIALCCVEFENNVPKKIQYAGANNPLWIINPKRKEAPKGAIQFKQGNGFEIKANKQAIGYTENLKPFTNHSFNIVEGDTFYTFSDGFADQFGGSDGKKYKSVTFKKLLSDINAQDMNEQKRIIEQVFNDWRKNLEQLDDVCVIGVRL